MIDTAMAQEELNHISCAMVLGQTQALGYGGNPEPFDAWIQKKNAQDQEGQS